MLTVEHYELIRRKVLIDGMSRRAVAKELGHSRKSVDKALAQAAPPGYRLSRPRRQPALEPFRAIIDAWLEEDQLRPRKQRHTAQRVYERLRAEHRYGGSACTVRRYVARRRQGRQEVFMPLVFAPGEEAQVEGAIPLVRVTWPEYAFSRRGTRRELIL
jgi:transposase